MNIREKCKNLISENISFIFYTPAVLWQVIFLYIPFFLILYSSISYKGVSGQVLGFENYRFLFDIDYVRIIMRSAAIAFGVSFLCLMCAYPIAYYLALKVDNRWKNILLFLLTLPFWTNLLILVYSWIFIFDHNGLINTFLCALGFIKEPLHLAHNIYAIMFVMFYYYVPFMIMPLYAILEKIQPDILEASADLGATHWQTFKRITIPLSMTGIKTGVLLVFVPAFGDFVIPSMIGGSRDLFVGSLITHYFLVVRDTGLGAAFTIISGIVLIACSLLFNWLCQASYNTSRKEPIL